MDIAYKIYKSSHFHEDSVRNIRVASTALDIITVLRKITIDLLYFWDVYDVDPWEKNFGRSTAYSGRTNIFI